jgi:hypothetical protein
MSSFDAFAEMPALADWQIDEWTTISFERLQVFKDQTVAADYVVSAAHRMLKLRKVKL